MEYSFRERNDLNGTGKRLMVPEPTFCDQISYRDFLKECAASGSGFTEADIDGAVRRIVSRLGFYMELGHSVKIDALGIFRLKLGLKKGEEVLTLNDLRRRHPTEKVEVDGILFRSDPESGIVDVGSSNQLRYVKRAPLAEMRDYPGERMPLEFDE